ncbi:SMC family ATPase [Nodosilinea sp. LEGE 07088]|uniref:AAA family ATPase n=1 Tax=Nodosilinea sp. LEGE 07088 TaxID=2777968 RepID=UPI001882B7B7|nr:SMC family ATPase [Nodosilinea sp. LEGE 07088]MBE9139454.1 SMC family ATPase [Nodosilinea sp. LEGE 07088]
MQILSVALQNFKTHRDRYFEFQPGTNAICGENGAGKTSILEAIAWVLFNYQGDYAKEDLIRNGSGSAQVTVAFTSNYDSRTYRVQRCTQRGYTLFDPQLNERLPYTRIKDEVLPWLRQHLGVGAGTNLPQLFARTLGVPQGTFTADFLQPAEQRKTVFDAILKVEDYKLAFKQMNALRRYAEDQVETTKIQIAQYDDSLTIWPDLQERQQLLVQAIATSKTRLREIETALAQLARQRDALRTQAQQVQTLTAERQGLTHQLEGKQAGIAQLQRSVQQAEQAIGLCQTHRAAYESYQATEQTLQVLGQQQQQRQQWQTELQTLQATQSQKQVDLARWQTQLESFVAIERDLAHLQSLITTQEQLESQRQQLQQQIEHYQRCRMQQQQSRAQLEQLAQQLAEATKTRDRLIALQPSVEEISGLEDQRNRTQQQLSRIAAARQFEAELSTLVTTSRQQGQAQQAEVDAMLAELATQAASLPLLSNPLLDRLEQSLRSTSALHDALVTDLEDILRDLAHQTDVAELKTTLKTVEADLKQRYRWRAEIDQLDGVVTQIQTTQQTQATLAAQLDDLAQQIATQTTTEAAIASIDQELEALGRPREKSQILQRTLQDKSRVEQTHASQAADLNDLNQQIEALSTRLKRYADLDQQLAQLQRDRTLHQTGYNIYLQNQQLANQHSPLQAELTTATAELATLQQQQQTLEQALQTALASFDPAAAAALETTYNATQSEADQLAGSLPQQQQRLSDLNQQITGLEAIAQRRDEAQHQLQAKEKAKRFINFARRAYNEAGPRITEQYVRSISHQADRLFRDLLNRPNVALQWTRDYEILVQEGPNQRRFVNLSGGEQMCAALAVRLALLKVLADVDIAFFDEPTTNLDRARRQGLAEAIGRIKTFQQLFVISHDDTFEQLTENVILVEREAD